MKTVFKSEEGERAVRERYLTILKHWPVPNEQLRVPTREGETFVVVSGPEKAPALVLLHGSAATSAMWMSDIPAWTAHFRIYAIDMIGEPGLSAPSRPPLASEAHALWLDDVWKALHLKRASLVGVSLGGWLALDYATRRPERAESLVVLCPGGVGRQKSGFIFKAMALRMLGSWGERKIQALVFGRAVTDLVADPSPALRYFMEYVALIHQNFRYRTVKLPVFSDDALKRLTMPLMAIVGGRDVLLDSADTRRRLERLLPHTEIHYLPEVRHFIPSQTTPILDFLMGKAVSQRR
jgi:pimeloyl-ACP methyl ester carboxylesterase